MATAPLTPAHGALLLPLPPSAQAILDCVQDIVAESVESQSLAILSNSGKVETNAVRIVVREMINDSLALDETLQPYNARFAAAGLLVLAADSGGLNLPDFDGLDGAVTYDAERGGFQVVHDEDFTPVLWAWIGATLMMMYKVPGATRFTYSGGAAVVSAKEVAFAPVEDWLTNEMAAQETGDRYYLGDFREREPETPAQVHQRVIVDVGGKLGAVGAADHVAMHWYEDEVGRRVHPSDSATLPDQGDKVGKKEVPEMSLTGDRFEFSTGMSVEPLWPRRISVHEYQVLRRHVEEVVAE